ncbi:SpoIIE family protein phosphatase, partial [bacterium]|nr:SpoIIE family protein phosphatase [bacterium]MBU1025994.1 SpoIIE family protein phosphatase [bacterium]
MLFPRSSKSNMDPKILLEICEASPRGVLVASQDGLIIHINRRLIDALRINLDLEIGKPLQKSRIFGDKRQRALMRLVEEGKPFKFTNILMKGEEANYWEFSGHEFPGGFVVEGEDKTIDVMRRKNEKLLENEYKSEIEIAQGLQRDLFLANFQKKRIDVNTHLTTAENLAGDFFSITELSPNAIGVVIGDVVGKGIPASLMGMSIHTLFMQEAKLMRPPSELLALVNNMLYSRFKGDFWYATAFYAQILVTNLTVTYSRAGHEFPLVYKAATGEVEMLPGEGLPLGMFPNSSYQTKRIQLEDDDRLLLFTDGLPDAISPMGQRLGHDWVTEFLKKNGKNHGREILDELTKEVHDFCSGYKPVDDIGIAIFAVVPDMWTTWEIPPKSFDEMLDSILNELDDSGIDNDTQWDIRLALDECVMNAHKHGNKYNLDSPVSVSYLIKQDSAVFKIQDSGDGFAYENLPDPTLESNIFIEHGRGVF